MEKQCNCGNGSGCCGGHGGEHGHAHQHAHGEGCGCGGHGGEHGHAHQHAHGEGCGCGGHHGEHGHAHQHAHGEGCGCGGHGEHGHHHAHQHTHGEGCGCGGHHGEHGHAHQHAHDDFEETVVIVSAPATPEQLDFLRNFERVAPLPVAKYIVKSSKEHSFESVALRDVCLRSAEDSIPLIKETAAFLQGLAASNLIAIDYDAPLSEESYAHFYSADSFLLFEETVAHGAEQETFLGDIAALEAGSIRLTEWGKEQIAE